MGLLLAMAFSAGAKKPEEQPDRPVTSILIPLQIDSLFKGTSYKYGNSIPRFALPYLEFYHGVLLAVEALKAQRIPAIIQVIDTRRGGGLATVLSDYDTKRSNLLIGVAQNATDLKMMADFAKARSIPFVSATFPNDGNVKENPHMAIMNPTIRTHCQGLVKYINNNHPIDNITVLTRKGSAETMLNQWLDEGANTNTPKWKRVTLVDTFAARQILTYLDSTRNNTLVVSSMDAAFGQRLLRQVAAFKGKYPVTIVGMPTWDDFDLRKSEFRGLTVVYSTPFEPLSTNIDLHRNLSAKYETIANSKPSDMALKGYEFTYRFARQLAGIGEEGNLFETTFIADPFCFSTLELKPVVEIDKPGQINYYENQKLYFIKKTDGLVKGIY
jgi:hypothetical protein